MFPARHGPYHWIFAAGWLSFVAMQRRRFLQLTTAAAVLHAFRRGLSFAKGDNNPMLDPWTGAHGGFPRFDKFKIEQFKPAVATGMDLQRAEIAAIVAAKDPPSFDNTIAKLETSGRPYSRVTRIFGVYSGTLADKPMQKLDEELSPQFAAFGDEIVQNDKLFARIKAVHDAAPKLTTEQQRLLDVTYHDFARRGAALGAKDKARLKEINGKLASLYTKFRQNELADEEGYQLVLDKEADLAGLPDSVRAAAKATAEEKKMPGKWVFTNTRSSMEPLLVYSSRRDLREKGWRMWTSRGDNPGAHDNKPIITQILALRGERAKLLGFATHAHWIIDDNMAKTPDAAMALMMKVWRAATARAHEEVTDMQKIVDGDKGGFKIAPWDYRYYAEKVRKAKYDLDQNEVKQYLQLDKMREAMMWAAGQLYGFSFVLVKDIPVCHPDVSVYEVMRGGKHLGLWYFDPYARDGKSSGAWMNEYRTQETFAGEISPIVSNNSNFVKGKPGEPVLISWDDATTMFHEFGHALHGLNSSVHYPTLAGTNVKRDFVEFPSQLNERWLPTHEVLTKFAVHYQTGKPMPDDLLAKINKAKTFNQGFSTCEYLASAIYDLEIHMTPTDKPIDAAAFEKATMAKIGCPPEIVMRHRPTQFGHIFADDGYSAGYYVYIWADTLTADAAEAFVEAGSFYDAKTAKRLHDTIMSVGNSVPPEVAFRNFRGRDVDTNALMRDRGFPTTA
ncbi:MAG TPA: M3 family metallopeptidase [Kofleriaceae bacterium]|nr:M3 family metallopeptidase [Kofleriaceae bacterium]